MTIEDDVLRHVMSRIGELGERVTALEAARVTFEEVAVDVAALKEHLIPFEVGVKGNLQGLIRDVSDLNAEVADLQFRVQSLEAARVTPAEARESELVCGACGHPKWAHGWRNAHAYGDDCTVGMCDCTSCRPADPPASEPAPTVALDPDQSCCMVCRIPLRAGFQEFCIPCWYRVTEAAERRGWNVIPK